MAVSKEDVLAYLNAMNAGSDSVEQKEENKPKKKASIKWQPKKWRPEYERVVQLSIRGASNVQVAELSGFTKEYVSMILNLPEAQKIKDDYIASMRKETVIDLPKTFQRIVEKTADRLLKLVEDDVAFDKSPFAIIDRGLRVANGLGVAGINSGEKGSVINNNLIMPAEAVDRLIEGLTKANKAKQLNSGRDITMITNNETETAVHTRDEATHDNGDAKTGPDQDP